MIPTIFIITITHQDTYVGICTSTAKQFLEIRRQVVAAVVLLNLGRPIMLSCADEHLLSISRNDTVHGALAVNLQPLGHRRRLGALACWRRACRDRR